jgi:CRP-like cAMP-binding protein
MTLSTHEKRELLRRVSLFEGSDDDCLDVLAQEVREVDFETGAYIARQGEMGTGFYLVLSGCAKVERHGTEIARFGPGDYFGELSLLSHQPRVASVIATEPTCCLALASWELDEVMKKNPPVALMLLKEAGRRLHELEAED